MMKVKTWQRILFCMLLVGLFAETPSLYAGSFLMMPSYVEDSNPNSIIASKNDYYLKPLKYASNPEMFMIVDLNKSKASQFAAKSQNELPKFAAKALPAMTKPETKVPAKKQGAVAVTAPRREQVIHTVKVMATGYTAWLRVHGQTPFAPAIRHNLLRRESAEGQKHDLDDCGRPARVSAGHHFVHSRLRVRDRRRRRLRH